MFFALFPTEAAYNARHSVIAMQRGYPIKGKDRRGRITDKGPTTHYNHAFYHPVTGQVYAIFEDDISQAGLNVVTKDELAALGFPPRDVAA